MIPAMNLSGGLPGLLTGQTGGWANCFVIPILLFAQPWTAGLIVLSFLSFSLPSRGRLG